MFSSASAHKLLLEEQCLCSIGCVLPCSSTQASPLKSRLCVQGRSRTAVTSAPCVRMCGPLCRFVRCRKTENFITSQLSGERTNYGLVQSEIQVDVVLSAAWICVQGIAPSNQGSVRSSVARRLSSGNHLSIDRTKTRNRLFSSPSKTVSARPREVSGTTTPPTPFQ